MITINLSEKQARVLLDVIGDQLHTKGAAAELLNQIEIQLTPVSTKQAEYAAWKSERILPNIIKAWKPKHIKEIKVDDQFTDELSPSKVAQYQLRYMVSVYNQVIGVNYSFGRGK
ncbi:hypothetical protein HOS16_gp48 [Shigella phage vB_SflS-ISF001]|uniref:Uncharacterized protein n=1 Tax=Shigella phage vB_SflS-ISF001 TaxID=2048005 RepID=A0A2D1GQ03_9CAUD|nr:hypothetical protein HOS16_gp48 [Shigella phage vB_SflS-ISF001]ATN94126.1 hypothetical protein FLXISF001_048 [Shigella phage vB_SflS-ISF001]